MLLSESDCSEILEAKLGHTDFQLEDFSLKYFDEILGFHANHAYLTITAVVNGKLTEYKFFVKTGTDNPIIKEKYWDILRQFYKEHVFMTRLQKTLQSFVEEKITADCYFSRLEQISVLEDLGALNYKPSKSLICDWQHAEKAVEAFANLHAAAILYEEKTGVVIEEKYRDLDYESMLLFEYDKKPDEFVLFSVDKGMHILLKKFFPNISDDARVKMLGKVRRRITDVLKHDKKFRKVVCQGDPWGNNLLYKYDNEGKPTDAILVDFGCLRIGPPGMDLMQFLYLGATNEFRDKYKNKIKSVYYDNLGRILSQNGVDVTTALPQKQFLESCDVYEEFAVCNRLYYAFISRIPGEYLLQAARSPEKFLGLFTLGDPELPLKAFQKDEGYKKGLIEAVDDTMRYYESKQ